MQVWVAWCHSCARDGQAARSSPRGIGNAGWGWAFALQMGIHMQSGKFLISSVQCETRKTGNPKWGQGMFAPAKQHQA